MSVIAELLGASLGGVLPAVRFFQPTPRFFSAMRRFSGRQVYDVGAGCGHVAAELYAHGHHVVALDTTPRTEMVFPVKRANGATYDYMAGSVVLLCRPCHGPFPLYVVRKAVERGAVAVCYAGFARNRTSDLGTFSRFFRLEARQVGADGERLYVLDFGTKEVE